MAACRWPALTARPRGPTTVAGTGGRPRSGKAAGQGMRGALAAQAGLVAAGLPCLILAGMAQALYGPSLPVFARSHALETSQLGLLLAAHWGGGASAIALMVLAPGRLPPRAGLAVFAAGAAAIALGPVWWAMLAGAAAIGAGGAILSTVYNRSFLALFAARGPAMVALLNAMFGLGAIIGPLAWVALGQDPRAAYLGLALLAALMLPLAAAGGGGPRPAAAALSGAATLPPDPGRFLPNWGILAFGAVAVGLEASLAGLGPTALIALGTDEARSAELMSLFFLAFLAGRLLLVALAGRVPAFTLFALSVAGLGLLALAAALGAGAVAFVPAGAFVGAVFPTYFVVAARLMGAHPRVAPAIMSAGLAGGILLPPALTLAMAQLGDGVLFAAVAGVALATALAALLRLRAVNGAAAPVRA